MLSSSLKERCREFFIQLVTSASRYRSSTEDAEGQTERTTASSNIRTSVDRNCVIICDQGSLRALNSFCRLSDLYECGVTSVEALERERQPLPTLDAIYVFDPEDADALSKLKNDFDGKRVQHENIHLVLSRPAAENVFRDFSTNANLAPHIRSLREVPILQFLVFHRNVFHFDLSGGLRNPKLEKSLAAAGRGNRHDGRAAGGGSLDPYSIAVTVGNAVTSSSYEQNKDQQTEEEGLLTRRSISLLPGVSQFYPRCADWRFQQTLKSLHSLLMVIGAPSNVVLKYQRNSVDNVCEMLARRLSRQINNSANPSGNVSTSVAGFVGSRDHHDRGRAATSGSYQRGGSSGSRSGSRGRNASSARTGGVAMSIGGRASNDGETVAIIVDRTYDLAACLVHEYTYEALVYDVLDLPHYGLNVETGVISHSKNVASMGGSSSSGGEPQSDEVLSDDLWEQLGGEHFVDAQGYVFAEAAKLSEQFSGLSKLEKHGLSNMTTETLAQMVRERPQYQELLRKYHFHVDLFEKAAHQLNDDKMMGNKIDLCVFEQDLACGVDREGREMKTIRYVSVLTQLLTDPGLDLCPEVKLRLLLLYFSVIGNVPDSGRRQLMEAARLRDTEQRCILNLLEMTRNQNQQLSNQGAGAGGGAVSTSLMGKMASRGAVVMPAAKGRDNAPFHRATPKEIKKFRQIAKSARFDMSRFEPKVRELCEGLITAGGSLPETEFGSIQCGSGGGVSSGPSATVGAALEQVDLSSWDFSRADQSGDRGSTGQGAGSTASNSKQGLPPHLGGAGALQPGGAASSPGTTRAREKKMQLVLFVLGGICLSEVRELEALERKYGGTVSILVGGSQLLTPKKMLEFLKDDYADLHRGGGDGSMF
ncbi:unnamed protein product [Amoebophrya sp. A25]|nr:unnamed protein product [Amoebophrya sp. A25]|eukprot:GSA25T00010624001.1